MTPDLEIYYKHSQDDVDRELFAILECGPLPSVTLGHVVLLDLTRNPMLYGGAAMSEDMFEAMFILYSGPSAVEPIRRAMVDPDGDDWFGTVELPPQVEAMLDDTKALASAAALLRRSISDAMAGLELIHPVKSKHDGETLTNDTGPSERVFATPEYVAGILASLSGTCLRANPHEILWETPMVLITHLLAACAVSAETYRPRDPEKTRQALERLNEEMNGHHPV